MSLSRLPASRPLRDTLSVRWDGVVYDCDFNQQLVGRGGARGLEGRREATWEAGRSPRMEGSNVWHVVGVRCPANRRWP